MPLAILLSKRDSRSLQDQVFDQIRDLILGARLKVGQPMPGSRALAEHLGVSRNTVTIVYEKLLSEGYLEIRPNVGAFVARDLPDRALAPAPPALPNASSAVPSAAAARAGTGAGAGTGTGVGAGTVLDRVAEADFPLQAIEHPQGRGLHTDFWVGRVDRGGFPVTEWCRIVEAKLRHGLQNQTRYGDTQGEPHLRRAIADHLGLARGIACAPDDIIVTGGTQDGLMLIARALRGHCAAFVHEDPCYQGARFLFAQSGFRACPVPVDRDGLVVEALPEMRHAVVYVTPSHQFPTGTTLSLPRRLRLVDWAERTDSLIVEDDYDGDFRYEGGPFTALRGLDRGGRVLYLGTFSKSMGPGLRLGFIAASGRVATALARWKHLFSNGTTWITQAATAEFLESGAFQRHLRRIRTRYRQRRDALIDAIEVHFPGSEILGRRGGMHLSWRLPRGGDARRLQRLALRHGIGIYTVEDGGACLSTADRRHRDLLMLGYAAVEEERITRAIAALAELDRREA